MGLILDSSILIAAERRQQKIADVLDSIEHRFGDEDAALSSVGLTELAHGVYRAPTQILRLRHQRFLDEVLATFEIYPYTRETALLAGKINAQQQASSFTVPFPTF